MTDTPKERAPRRKLTVADRLREMDAAQAARDKRDEQRVADAREALADAELARTMNQNAYAEKRARIVREALERADDLKRQVGEE